MRIQLDQLEMEEAIHNYIDAQGMDLSNINMEIEFTAGRGGNGFTTVVALSKKDDPDIITIPIEMDVSDTEEEEKEIPDSTELEFNDK